MELLRRAGFAADYLDEIVSCPKCRDSGIYEGGVCSCLEKLYNAELTKELGTLLQHGDERFKVVFGDCYHILLWLGRIHGVF